MDMEQILVIFNPAAKGEKALRVVDRIRALSPRIVLKSTKGPGDAEALAERAVDQGYRTVVAAGGDGTINQVVNGLEGSDVQLGILPVGTMNVFASELGIPGNSLPKAWKIIEDGHVRIIDLPKANDLFFIQLAGIGLDAQIVIETDLTFRKNFGPLSYLMTATQIAARKPPKIFVTGSDGIKRSGSFVLIGNGRFYGGPFVLFNNAKIDDQLLDVLIFKNLGYMDIIRYLQGVVMGTHAKMKDVDYFQSSTVHIESADDVPVEVDGEVIGHLPFEFTFNHTPLRVLAPKAGKDGHKNASKN